VVYEANLAGDARETLDKKQFEMGLADGVERSGCWKWQRPLVGLDKSH